MTASMIVNYDNDSLKDEEVNKLESPNKPKKDVDPSLNLILDYETIPNETTTKDYEATENPKEDQKTLEDDQH